MKKNFFVTVAAVVVVLTTSCGNGNSSTPTEVVDSMTQKYDSVDGIKTENIEKKDILVFNVAHHHVCRGTVKRTNTITTRYRNGEPYTTSTNYGKWFVEYTLFVDISSGNYLGEVDQQVDTVCNFVRTAKGFVPAEVSIKKLGEYRRVSPNKIEEKIRWTFTTKDRQYTQECYCPIFRK